jgi:hypothetical protein
MEKDDYMQLSKEEKDRRRAEYEKWRREQNQ